MNKIGILTGIILMILGAVEQMTIVFSIGLSLMMMSLAGELFKGKLRNVLEEIALRLRIGRLDRYRKMNHHELQEAEEWMSRFALRYQVLLRSSFGITPQGKVRIQRINAEKEDGEEIFAEFVQFLQSKGIQINNDYLRLEINDRIFRSRIEQFQTVLSTMIEKRPTLEELLHIYLEEEGRVESLSSLKHFWNRQILLLYIQEVYSQAEIRQLFPQRFKRLEAQMRQWLQKLEQKMAIRKRFEHFEEWLVGVQDEISISISHFDRATRNFTDFRMGIVYLLEKIGYRVTLPPETYEGIDLLIERSGICHGVVIKPLTEEESISTTIIHELHSARTLAELQSVMLITNRSITSAAMKLATRLGLICIDREKLCQWLDQYTNPFQQSS